MSDDWKQELWAKLVSEDSANLPMVIIVYKQTYESLLEILK